MLVLSRKKDESIVINNDITIVVVEIRGDKVRLGVEAPKEVPVHRKEVFDAIARGEEFDVVKSGTCDSSEIGAPLPEVISGGSTDLSRGDGSAGDSRSAAEPPL